MPHRTPVAARHMAQRARPARTVGPAQHEPAPAALRRDRPHRRHAHRRARSRSVTGTRSPSRRGCVHPAVLAHRTIATPSPADASALRIGRVDAPQKPGGAGVTGARFRRRAFTGSTAPDPRHATAREARGIDAVVERCAGACRTVDRHGARTRPVAAPRQRSAAASRAGLPTAPDPARRDSTGPRARPARATARLGSPFPTCSSGGAAGPTSR